MQGTALTTQARHMLGSSPETPLIIPTRTQDPLCLHTHHRTHLTRRIMPCPPGPRPVTHIETTSAECYDPYADPYQNPWKDYEEYEPYSEGTYHIRPNPLPQHHVAFNKPEVTAEIGRA